MVLRAPGRGGPRDGCPQTGRAGRAVSLASKQASEPQSEFLYSAHKGDMYAVTA